MKLTAEMKKQIKALAEEHSYDYDYIALRIQEVPFSLGPIDHYSKVWIDGDETDKELDGICGIKVDFIDLIQGEYLGEYAALIAGNSAEYGEDVGEVIISNAEVIEIIA